MSSKVVSIQDYNTNNDLKNKQIRILLDKTRKYKQDLDKIKSVYTGFKSGVLEFTEKHKQEISKLHNIIKGLESEIESLQSENETIKGSYEVLSCDSNDFDLERELKNIMKPLEEEYKSEYEKIGRSELYKLLSL